jgi:tRNA-specific 2-thiouridylase
MMSLVPGKTPQETRVVVAMSGGVDSSVVAAMLKEQGYDVIGITLQLYDHGAALAKKGACCAGRDIHDAKRVAEQMNFPHYVLNYENIFKDSVMDDFADSYLAGATPIPCVRCNERVKFQDLLQTAKDLGADCMATGHYIQRKLNAQGRAELHRAADSTRDQSYFLFSTTQEQLDYLRFPLGHLKTKDETRALAKRYGLSVADKPDSQDICFVPQGKYTDIIERLRPGAGEPGDIVDQEGHVLGQHRGIIYYTIGQRRGLGVGGGDPLYVIRLDPDKRHVVVGTKEDLGVTSIPVKEINWLGDEALTENARVPIMARVRSTRTPVPAELVFLPSSEARVILQTPEEGVAPGQACVFYDRETSRVLGGGWINKA